MYSDLLIPLIIIIPLALLIGFTASAIGFAAWPIVVPILYGGLGYNIYLVLCFSLIIDFGNALVISTFSFITKEADFPLALKSAFLACIFVLTGVYFGTFFIPQNAGLFRGSIGIVSFCLGLFFLWRGYKLNKKEKVSKEETTSGSTLENNNEDTNTVIRNGILGPGVAGTGFLTGLIGIGGGANYSILLLLSNSFSTIRATSTGMIITFITTLFGALCIYFLIPNDITIEGYIIGLGIFTVASSMVGTFLGARIVYSLSESRVNFMIGILIVIASLVITGQKLLLT